MHEWSRASIGGLFLALVCATASAQTPSVDEIVSKTMAARGGLDKLRAVNTMKMVGKVSMQGRDFAITVMAKRPNLMLQEMTIDGARVVSAFDGEKVWVVNPMLGINEPQEMSGAMADEMRDQSIFGGPLMGYKERGETLELVGPEHRRRRQDVEAEAVTCERPDDVHRRRCRERLRAPVVTAR